MGQKTHPYGFRLGFNKGWLSLWYSKGKNYINLFHTDIKIRKLIKKKYKHAGISSIEIKGFQIQYVFRLTPPARGL